MYIYTYIAYLPLLTAEIYIYYYTDQYTPMYALKHMDAFCRPTRHTLLVIRLYTWQLALICQGNASHSAPKATVLFTLVFDPCAQRRANWRFVSMVTAIGVVQLMSATLPRTKIRRQISWPRCSSSKDQYDT